MPIQFNCPNCGKALRASSSKAGSKARCKSCGQTLTIPTDKQTQPRVSSKRSVSSEGTATAKSPLVATKTVATNTMAPATDSSKATPAVPPFPDSPFGDSTDKLVSEGGTNQGNLFADLPEFQTVDTPLEKQTGIDESFHKMMVDGVPQGQFIPDVLSEPQTSSAVPVESPPSVPSAAATVNPSGPSTGPDLTDLSNILEGFSDSIDSSVKQQLQKNEAAVRAKFTTAQIRAAFRQPIEKFQRIPGLHLKQLTSALAAVAVPVLFVVFVVGASFGMGALAISYFSSGAEGLPHPVIGLTYVVVAILLVACWLPTLILLFVGASLLFFRPRQDPASTQLTRESQPVMYEFVDQICDKLGAPKPCRIDLNCEFNASASLRRGWFSSTKNDLVLTIGIPFIAVQNTEQLASVIAHEFGHFRQGSAMKTSYMIGSITQWFMATAYAGSSYFYWFGYLTHMFSGSLSREMEWDADRHAIELAGSKAFEQSSAQLERFGAAYAVTIDNLFMLFQSGILVDNIPRFMMHIGRTLPAATIRRIAEQTEKQRADRLDSHPPTRDRVKAAREMNRPGILNLGRPAIDLVDHWSPLCKRITLDFYAERIGADREQIDESHVTPLDELLRAEHKLLLDLAEKQS